LNRIISVAYSRATLPQNPQFLAAASDYGTPGPGNIRFPLVPSLSVLQKHARDALDEEQLEMDDALAEEGSGVDVNRTQMCSESGRGEEPPAEKKSRVRFRDGPHP
jgi:hypothetical protein